MDSCIAISQTRLRLPVDR